MRTAYSYVRFSCLRQTNGRSTKRQKVGAVEICARHGWHLDDSLSLDDKGVSAFRSKNAKEGALGVFLRLIESGKIKRGSVLIVESLDRLSRDKMRVALRLFLAILDAGVDIQTTDPDRLYTADDMDDIGGLVEPLVVMSRAHEESARKSGFSKDAWRGKRQALAEGGHRGKHHPAWVKLEGGKYVEDVAKADTVRLIFRLAKEGRGAFLVAKYLNENGVKAIGKKPVWNTGYINLILSDRRVIGECQSYTQAYRNAKREEVGSPVVAYPVVVQPQDFYCVQSGRADRTTVKDDGTKTGRGGRGGRDSVNLFSGIIKDGAGSSMIVTSKGKRNFSAYIKSAAVRRQEGGPYVSFPYTLLETEILSLVVELSSGDLTGERESRLAQLATMEGEQQSLSDRIGKIQNMMAETPTPELQEVLTRLSNARKALTERYETAKAETAVVADHVGECQTLVQLLQTAADKADIRRRLKARLPRIIEGIVVVLRRTAERPGAPVEATVTVRWRRGDTAVLHLHSRQTYKMAVADPDRLGIGPDDVVHDGAERAAGILEAVK